MLPNTTSVKSLLLFVLDRELLLSFKLYTATPVPGGFSVPFGLKYNTRARAHNKHTHAHAHNPSRKVSY